MTYRKMERIVSLDSKVTSSQITISSPSLKLPQDQSNQSYGVFNGLRVCVLMLDSA